MKKITLLFLLFSFSLSLNADQEEIKNTIKLLVDKVEKNIAISTMDSLEQIIAPEVGKLALLDENNPDNREKNVGILSSLIVEFWDSRYQIQKNLKDLKEEHLLEEALQKQRQTFEYITIQTTKNHLVYKTPCYFLKALFLEETSFGAIEESFKVWMQEETASLEYLAATSEIAYLLFDASLKGLGKKILHKKKEITLNIGLLDKFVPTLPDAEMQAEGEVEKEMFKKDIENLNALYKNIIGTVYPKMSNTFESIKQAIFAEVKKAEESRNAKFQSFIDDRKNMYQNIEKAKSFASANKEGVYAVGPYLGKTIIKQPSSKSSVPFTKWDINPDYDPTKPVFKETLQKLAKNGLINFQG